MIPRTVFDSEHETFRGSVKKFVATEIEPFYHQWEKDGQVSRELWRKAGQRGFLAPTVPVEYGGVGADFRYNAIIDEELGRHGMPSISFGLHSGICVPYIINNGSEDQKQKYIPGCLSGDIVTAIAMTEPGTGSDLQGIKTTAVKDSDHYVLNGSKTFISNGQLADLFIVVCKTDPSAGAKGISLILVDPESCGFTRGTNLEKVGMKAQDTSELFSTIYEYPRRICLERRAGGSAI